MALLLAFTSRAIGAADGSADDESLASPYIWSLPAGFPEPLVPTDNPLTVQKVELGELLFNDKRLSVNATLSCASCHQPTAFFVDGLPRPKGALDELLEFNTPTLLNVAYSASFSWIDKGFESLEEQHRGPLTNTAPVELGLGEVQLSSLSADDALHAPLKRAFPGAERFTESNVVAALASYVRTLIRGDSAFDRLLFADDSSALSVEALTGLELFGSQHLNCVACHRGFLLSGPTRSARAQFSPSFYRTGVSNSDQAFRAPSLRFVRHTAPYMHDGSLASLEEVIDFYAAGAIAADDVSTQRMRSFELSHQERQALLAFLRSL